MAGIGDQMKMLNQMRKLQKELGREIVEVEAGDGAVVIQFNGELKVVDVQLDSDKINSDNLDELAGWIQAAIRDGLKEAQEMAAEKMKPMMGNLGNLGNLGLK
jgi:DNA-binding YbaB/EbfC family protein